MKDNIKVANINIKLKDLFIKWLEITKPFHKLSTQHQQVLSLLLYHHYLLKHEVTNEKILWKMVFDYDTKLKIKEELEMTDNTLQNVLTKLRRKNIIIDNKISPVYIPNLALKSKNFKILYNFNIIKNE
jgi:hypothetical protein